AAESFDAAGDFLSAGKKLLDTRCPAFKAVSAVRNNARGYWRAISLPFPEPAIRLIPQNRLSAFQDEMGRFRDELTLAVTNLDAEFEELKTAARIRLGTLYNERDYPASLDGAFEVSWDFPSVEPPTYLRRLDPELFEAESRRVQARFDEAVQMAEQAFVEELGRLVSHLTERLTGEADGQPKVFRDSAIGNLQEFFTRFQSLNLRSSEQLDSLVEQCQQIVQGVRPQTLRDDANLRREVASQLSGVTGLLDDLLVDRPRRRLLRAPK
ncbi:hypothetical protein LOC68_11175, partial [Blastopirellula sp. JC732]